MSPLGIRNNNPGNLDYVKGASWEGLAKPPYHGRFCAFVAPVYGLQALIMQILYDHYRHGKTTIAGVIATWAPPNENNTNAYVESVSSYVGLLSWDTVDFTDMGLVVGIAEGIVREENGSVPYQDALFKQAAAAAYKALKVVPRNTSGIPIVPPLTPNPKS